MSGNQRKEHLHRTFGLAQFQMQYFVSFCPVNGLGGEQWTLILHPRQQAALNFSVLPGST